MKSALFALILLFTFFCTPLKAQKTHTDSTDQKKVNKIVWAESGIYLATMTGLAILWYEDLSTPFRFFNDAKQWQGIDKLGHGFTAFHLTNGNAMLLEKAGIPRKRAYWTSTAISITAMAGIEVLDGFSPSYGASVPDLMANTVGALMPLQTLWWNDIYIHPKYSFHTTPYARLRPNTLGSSAFEYWLKDYNGQTYWLSTNFNLFSPNNSFPDWLAFSIGYGAEEMVYGSPQENRANGYRAVRSLYFSLDVDFTKFAPENKWLKVLFFGLNMIKVPLPTFELKNGEMRFHPIYF